MASALVETAALSRAGGKLLAVVTEYGTAAHPYSSSHALLSGPHAARNLADAIHFLCVLHGRHPGVIDHAASRCDEAAEWLASATQGFAQERALLTRLAVAAGPQPGTPGAGDTQAVLLGQRHALETLARSERKGCPLGAALALSLDWLSIRGVLNAAARRFSVEAPPFPTAWSLDAETVPDLVCGSPSIERALLFGAEQISLQHHGLWDLLDARQQARGPF